MLVALPAALRRGGYIGKQERTLVKKRGSRSSGMKGLVNDTCGLNEVHDDVESMV
jgi:hypothetical protein